MSLFTAANTQLSICNRALARAGTRKLITSLTTDTSQEAQYCALFWDETRQKLISEFPWKFATRVAALEQFSAQASSIERIGTGPATPFTVSALDCTGTFNCVIKVVVGGAAIGTAQVQGSCDGGQTWGGATTLTAGDLYFSADIPVGGGNTFKADVTLNFSAVTLIAGDLYRFTASDGISPEYQYAYTLPGDVLIGKYLWPGARGVRSDQRVVWKRGTIGNIDVLWTDASPDQTPQIIYVEDVTDSSRFPAGFANALSWALADELAKVLKAKPDADCMQKYLAAINAARATDFIEAQEDPVPDSPTIAARGYQWVPFGIGAVPPGGWWPY